MPIVPIIDGGRPDVGDAGADGGPDAGDAGRVPDAGSCQIGDSGLVAAGTWLDPTIGSCVLCDPSLNPVGWTALDGGQICEGFTSMQTFGPPVLPVSGLCGIFDSSLGCLAATAGSGCDGELAEPKAGCVGGFCNDAGWCEIDQNPGYAASCGDSHPSERLCPRTLLHGCGLRWLSW